MTIWAGFALGFLGSLHCVGMCGPIVLMLPVNQGGSKLSYLIGRVLYNLGRVVTYMVLGLLAGIIGKSLALGGYQQVVSIVFGGAIILGVIIPKKFWGRLFSLKGLDRFTDFLRRAFRSRFSNASHSSLFTIGFINGFLPCGFVYLAAAGAISTGSILDGILYMGLFGIGTAPVLIATSYAGRLFSLSLRRRLSRLIPVGIVLIGLLFVLRGLSLGIPYISPKAKVLTPAQHIHEPGCCH